MTSLSILIYAANATVARQLASRLRATPGYHVQATAAQRRLAALARRSPRPTVICLLLDADSAEPAALIGRLADAAPGCPIIVALSADDRRAAALRSAGIAQIVAAGPTLDPVIAAIARAEPGLPNHRAGPDDDLGAILDVAARINASTDPDEVFSSICEAAVQLFKVDHSGLVIFDESGGRGQVVAEFPPRQLRGTTIQVRGVPAEELLVHTGQPLVFAEIDAAVIAQFGPMAAIFAEHDIRSILIVPILSKGRVIGSFSLDTIGRTCAFDRRAVDMCRVFAAQVAIAFEKNQLLSEAHARSNQIESLRRTTLAVSTNPDQRQLLQTIIALAARLLGASGGGIYAYDTTLQTLRLAALYKHAAAQVAATLAVGEDVAGHLIAEDLSYLIVNDHTSWPGRAPTYRAGSPFAAIIAVVLRWAGRPAGVLFVDQPAERGSFQVAHADLLAPFADYAAIVLRNTDLARSSAATLQRLQLLGEASADLSASGDLAALVAGDSPGLAAHLQRVAEWAAHLLDAEASGVALVSDERPEWLQLVASYGNDGAGAPEGRAFRITQRPGAGLTGFIAAQGQLFRAHGEELLRHPAVRGVGSHTRSGACNAILALPLVSREAPRRMIGLLRVDNKRGPDGRSAPQIGFSDEDVQVLRIIASMAVTALEDSRRLSALSAAVSSAPGGVIVSSYEGTIIAANPQAGQLLGCDSATLAGRTLATFVPDESSAEQIRHAALAGADRPQAERLRLRRRDGELLPARVHSVRVCGWLGRPIGFVVHIEDLRALQAAEERVSFVSETALRVSRAHSLREALGELGDRMAAYVRAGSYWIFLLDADQRGLTLHVARAIQRAEAPPASAPSPDGTRISLAQWPAVSDLLFADRAALLTPGWPAPAERTLLIPIHTGERAIGLIALGMGADPALALAGADSRDLLAMIARQSAGQIVAFHQKALAEYQHYRLQSLDRMTFELRALQEPGRLRREILRLAIDLLNLTHGVLYRRHPGLDDLEVEFCIGFSSEAAADPQGDLAGLASRAPRNSHALLVRPPEAGAPAGPPAQAQPSCLIAVPLIETGDVTTVILVAGSYQDAERAAIDCAILERFARQAAASLQIAQTIGHKERTLQRIKLLNRMSRYLQDTRRLDRIAHVFLTAVTANYGLRFNRAALFTLNGASDSLIGLSAIGHINLEGAARDWAELQTESVDSFRAYIDLIERDSLPYTPLHSRINQLYLPLSDREPDILLDVLSAPQHSEPGCLVIDGGGDWDDFLPAALIEAFRPGAQLVIAPLIVPRHRLDAAQQVVGLLIADNKFTGEPISEDDLEDLLTFAQAAASAIANQQQLEANQGARDLLSALLDRPGAPPHSRSLAHRLSAPYQVLQQAAERISHATGAMWASIVLVDHQGEATQAFSSEDGAFRANGSIRPNGVSAEVLREGRPAIFEQTDLYRKRLNPIIFRRRVGAAVCLPLIADGQRVGVTWIHWAAPRRIFGSLLDAIRLYLIQTMRGYADARRLELLGAVYEMAATVARAESWDQVLSQVADAARRIFHGDSAVVWAIDPEAGDFVPGRAAALNIPASVWERARRNVPRPYSTAHNVLRERWLPIEDLRSAETQQILGPTTRRLLSDIHAAAFQGIGLSLGDEEIGALFVAYQRRQSFTADDRHSAAIFANYAALVIKQAWLRDSLRQATERLAVADQTARLISSLSALGDIRPTLQSIVESACRLLGSDIATIYACDPQRRRLTLPPIHSQVRDPAHLASGACVLQNSLVLLILDADGIVEVPDVRAHPRFSISHFARQEDVVSCAACPLIFGQERLGVLFISYRAPHSFSQSDREHIRLLADQAAIAIHNDQLFQTRQRQLKTQEVIAQVGAAITRTLVQDALSSEPDGALAPWADPPGHEQLNRIVELTLDLVPESIRDSGFAHLAMREGDHLRFTAAHPRAHLRQLRASLGDVSLSAPQPRIGIMGRAVLSGRAEYVDNVQLDGDYLCYSPQTCSQLCAPIRRNDRVIGVISIESPDIAAFDQDDVNALQLLADYAATVTQNARLYQRIETVRRIGREATASLEIDTLLPEICKRLRGELFSDAMISIRLRVEGADELIFDPRWSAPPLPGDVLHQPFSQGICGYVARTKSPVNRPDVYQAVEPPYVKLSPKPFITRSELCVPIVYGDVIGVLDLQSPRSYAFEDDDTRLLEILATQLATSIRKARDYTDLRALQTRIAEGIAQKSIAIMANSWQHAIGQKANNVRKIVRRLLTDMHRAAGQPPDSALLQGRLAMIDDEMNEILNRQFTIMPLDPGAEPAMIDTVIRTYVEDLPAHWPQDLRMVRPQLMLNAGRKVRAAHAWINIVLELLLQNAIEAVQPIASPRISITTRTYGSDVEVTISDNGPGFGDDIRGLIFRSQVRKPSREPVRGIGLLIAKAIVDSYEGSIQIVESGGGGATVAFRLPCIV